MIFEDWLFENSLWLTEPGRSPADRFRRVWEAAVMEERERIAKECDKRAAGHERNRLATVVNPAFWAAKRTEAEDIAALVRRGKA